MRAPSPLIGDIYQDSYSRFADNVAVEDARRRLSYAEMGVAAHRFANALRAAGAAAGERVILLGANSCEWVIADQGLAIGGYARVGLLPRLHPVEIRHIANDVEPFAIVVAADWLAENGVDWIPPKVEKLIVISGRARQQPRGAIDFDAFLATGSVDELPPLDPAAVAWLMFTSGTTGRPKGVMCPQRAVGAMVRDTLREVGFRATDVAFHSSPISHFSGSMQVTLAAVGGKNILRPTFERGEVIQAALGGEVTVLPLVPTMISMVLEELAARGHAAGQLGSVRLVPYSGSAIQPDRAELAQAHFGPVMLQLYGSSEVPAPISVLHPLDHRLDVLNRAGAPRIASAGKIASCAEVRIVASDGTTLTDRYEVGEIVVKTDTVASGYWRQPHATSETFKDGWCFTGDIGYVDEDDFLFIVDRRKDMIISGGFNIFSREVENAISTLPGVREVAVVGTPDSRWGEVVTAVISVEGQARLSTADVIEHCRGVIGRYKVPKRVIFLENLPKGPSGKLLKSELKRRLTASDG